MVVQLVIIIYANIFLNNYKIFICIRAFFSRQYTIFKKEIIKTCFQNRKKKKI